VSEIDRSWFVVDAAGQRLGTLASRIALVLEGKHKPTYATHVDTGDHVIVLNAARVDIGRGKTEQKLYSRHSGYPGGYREETLGDLLARRPEEVIRRAVKGMLPRNKLGVQQLRKLKIYSGTDHPHEAQLPEPLPGTTLSFTPGTTNKPKPEKVATAPMATDEEPAVEETAAPESQAEGDEETTPQATAEEVAVPEVEAAAEEAPEAAEEEAKSGGSDE
jgi:large subunit ribosomal protein L13